MLGSRFCTAPWLARSELMDGYTVCTLLLSYLFNSEIDSSPLGETTIYKSHAHLYNTYSLHIHISGSSVRNHVNVSRSLCLILMAVTKCNMWTLLQVPLRATIVVTQEHLTLLSITTDIIVVVVERSVWVHEVLYQLLRLYRVVSWF